MADVRMDLYGGTIELLIRGRKCINFRYRDVKRFDVQPLLTGVLTQDGHCTLPTLGITDVVQ